jgi:hypothetical protein
MAFILNGREIAPCIVAKAKYALGVTTNKPANKKPCSQTYWNEVVLYIGNTKNKSQIEIVNAIKRTDLFRYKNSN